MSVIHEKAKGQFMLLLDILASLLVVLVSIVSYWLVKLRFGQFAGIGGGLLSGLALATVVRAYHRWNLRCIERSCNELSEKFPDVFRVIGLPTDSRCIVKADGAEIVVGDYGWEAEPIRSDGLTYLHGLSERWFVVWYAGFRPDQIQRIGPKPHTQYYLPYLRLVLGQFEDVKCPFPVQNVGTASLGYPVRIIGNSVQGKRVET